MVWNRVWSADSNTNNQELQMFMEIQNSTNFSYKSQCYFSPNSDIMFMEIKNSINLSYKYKWCVFIFFEGVPPYAPWAEGDSGRSRLIPLPEGSLVTGMYGGW